MIGVFSIAQAQIAFAANDDWRAIRIDNGTKSQGAICFYDSASVLKADKGYIRVLEKCLDTDEIKTVEASHVAGKSALDRDAMAKMKVGYKSPLSAYDQMDNGGLIVMELELDRYDFSGFDSMALLELDCSGKRIRTLQKATMNNGTPQTTSKLGEWVSLNRGADKNRYVGLLCN